MTLLIGLAITITVGGIYWYQSYRQDKEIYVMVKVWEKQIERERKEKKK